MILIPVIFGSTQKSPIFGLEEVSFPQLIGRQGKVGGFIPNYNTLLVTCQVGDDLYVAIVIYRSSLELKDESIASNFQTG
jgi:hypothetical protein